MSIINQINRTITSFIPGSKSNRTLDCIEKIQNFTADDKENKKTSEEINSFIKEVSHSCKAIYDIRKFNPADDPNDSLLQAELSNLDDLANLRDKEELNRLPPKERDEIIRERERLIIKNISDWEDRTKMGGKKKNTRRNRRKNTRKLRKSKRKSMKKI
jgi:hypothetical protein